MTSIAPVRVSDLVSAQRPDAHPTQAAEQRHRRDPEPTDSAPQTQALALTNPVLESLYAAAYDPRMLTPDATPRGVEIDRIKMIEEGFEHIRDLIQTISANSEDAAGDAVSMDVTV